MSLAIPKNLLPERDAVEREIRQAFRGVTREGGTSWSESVIVDNDGSGRTREQARAEDTDKSWEELLDDPNWHPDPGMGGFNFLDPIGYHYYIAAAMLHSLHDVSSQERVATALEVCYSPFKEELVSAITPRQGHAIARFLRYMIALDGALGDTEAVERWSRDYRTYWKSFDRGTPLSG
jgi:hypothetical protein